MTREVRRNVAIISRQLHKFRQTRIDFGIFFFLRNQPAGVMIVKKIVLEVVDKTKYPDDILYNSKNSSK